MRFRARLAQPTTSLLVSNARLRRQRDRGRWHRRERKLESNLTSLAAPCSRHRLVAGTRPYSRHRSAAFSFSDPEREHWRWADLLSFDLSRGSAPQRAVLTVRARRRV